jgi:hypothetical protein
MDPTHVVFSISLSEYLPKKHQNMILGHQVRGLIDIGRKICKRRHLPWGLGLEHFVSCVSISVSVSVASLASLAPQIMLSAWFQSEGLQRQKWICSNRCIRCRQSTKHPAFLAVMCVTNYTGDRMQNFADWVRTLTVSNLDSKGFKEHWSKQLQYFCCGGHHAKNITPCGNFLLLTCSSWLSVTQWRLPISIYGSFLVNDRLHGMKKR